MIFGNKYNQEELGEGWGMHLHNCILEKHLLQYQKRDMVELCILSLGKIYYFSDFFLEHWIKMAI